MARRLNLDLRPLFRRFARAEAKAYADALASLPPKARPDGTPTGGSLAKRLRSAAAVRVTRWGFVIRLAQAGQKLTWLVRGTKRQPARPLQGVPDRADELERAVADEVASQFASWDQGARGA